MVPALENLKKFGTYFFVKAFNAGPLEAIMALHVPS